MNQMSFAFFFLSHSGFAFIKHIRKMYNFPTLLLMLNWFPAWIKKSISEEKETSNLMSILLITI